jgi:hypothetical protein
MEVIESFLRKQALVKKWADAVLGYELSSDDLWEQLKSGVDLCRLMLKIKDGSIPTLHENPKIQFVKKENIMFFIEAVKEYGVPRYSIFSVADLYEERDLQRVLDCLEALAIKATANGLEQKYEVEADKAVRLPKLPSFSNDLSKADRRATRLMNRGRPLPNLPSGPPPLATGNLEATKPSGPILAGKAAIAAPSGAPSGPAPRHRPMPVPPLGLSQQPGTGSVSSPRAAAGSQTSPTIGNGPAHPKQPSASSSTAATGAPKIPLPTSPRDKPATLESCVLRLVSLAKGRLARRVHQQRVTDVAYRARVATEIMSTENVYVKSLNMIKNLFLDPLMSSVTSSKPLLVLDEVKSIFSSLEVIVAYNERLLSQLQPRVESWSPNQRLGDIFIQICGFLKVYTNYIANYNASMATLNRCRTKKEKFAQWLAEQEEKPELQGLKLGALLILPVQRIPRYQLLLSDLSKHTWSGHADYADLLKATSLIQEVAIYLNDKKREADNITKVTEIQEQFTWDEDLAQPHRRFVKDITLKTISGKEKEFKDRKFYFFNDLIVVTKPHRSTPLGMQFLSKASDKSKEKVVSSHHINSVSVAVYNGSAPAGASSSNEPSLYEVRDVNFGATDPKGLLYLVDAGTQAIRDEIITIYQHNSAEQKGKLIPMQQQVTIESDQKSLAKSGSIASRPSSIKPDKDSPTSRPSSIKPDKEESGEAGTDKKKGRPSRGKEWLSNIRSTLHGDPRKSKDGIVSGGSANGSNSTSVEVSMEDSSSSSDLSKSPEPGRGSKEINRSESSGSLTIHRQVVASKLPTGEIRDDLSPPSMPVSALSPRLSHSSQDENSGQGHDTHHDPLAGALSPRSSPPEDDSITAMRRASFKRSFTERPAVPPKPDRLRSGHNIGAGIVRKPAGASPSTPGGGAAAAGGGATIASIAAAGGVIAPTSSALEETSVQDDSSVAANAPSTASNALPSVQAPAPMRRAGTVTGDATLRRQNAFKSRTLTANTVDLMNAAAGYGSASVSGTSSTTNPSAAPNSNPTTTNNSALNAPVPLLPQVAALSPGVSPSPSPRNSGVSANSSQMDPSSSSPDLTSSDSSLHGSSSSSLPRPTRTAPSPRTSVAASTPPK